MAKQKLTVDGTSITIDANGFISITDIAKRSANIRPREVVRNWLRNLGTINYLEEWEKVHNPNFKGVQFDPFRKNAGKNDFIISPKMYIEQVGAIGMTSKSGRYGGTYTHSDIALNFCYWLNPKFQVYFLKEFQRLKNEEAIRLGLQFDLRRELTKTNYALQTDAIKQHLIPPKILTKQSSLYYANEADLLNVIVFGNTAKEWKAQHPNKKGNRRDYASIEQLILLLNMEALNATMINWEWSQEMRLQVLQTESKRQIPLIRKSAAMKRIKASESKKIK